MAIPSISNDGSDPESGNVIFFILLAIVLIGLVTAALRSGGDEGSNIDRENLVIKTTQVRQYAGELERAVVFVMQNGISEVDIRFAHPDAPSDYGDITVNPTNQVFGRTGGGAEYRQPPSGLNDGSNWEFYGGTHMPDVGSSRAELIAVMPNVTQEFCDKINEMDGYDSAVQPTDGGTCLYSGTSGRFGDATQFSGAPNTTTEATFTVKPAMQGCVECADNSLHFFHVLMAR
ncbi:MAG: hypothetical protein H6868_02405 [Rhodospirillales bacterium]|nr:hypothetical protein [Rhodospirillales bacterium]